MMAKLDFRTVLLTLFVAGTVCYSLCIAGDLLFGWTMYQIWAPLLPGFTWPLTYEKKQNGAGDFMPVRV